MIGTAGDSLSFDNGLKFSTRDVDNDYWSVSCAVHYRGAWWFSSCSRAHLNGEYLQGKHNRWQFYGVMWNYFKGGYYSNKKTEMKMAPLTN